MLILLMMLMFALFSLAVTYDNTQKNNDLEIEDWQGKLKDLDKENTVLRSAIEEKGLGNTPTKSRKFNWIEDIDTNHKIIPTAIASDTLTVSNVANIVKDDVFFNEETNKYFRVTQTPQAGSTSVKVVEIASENSETVPSGTTFLNKSFLKVYTSKPEGSNDHDGLIWNPENYSNVVSIFEDISRVADITAHEPWQMTDYSRREYEKVKNLIKHKTDQNTAIVIGKHFFDGVRMFSKGITNFPGLQVQTGNAFAADGKTLTFNIADFDLFIGNKVKKYSKSKRFFTACNNNYIIWVNALIRACSSLTFDPFGKKDEFGYTFKVLVHALAELELIVDESLNDLYPNHAVGINLVMNKIGLRHFDGFDTTVTPNVQPKGSHVYEDQIYTVGNGVQLVKPEHHSMLKLKMIGV